MPSNQEDMASRKANSSSNIANRWSTEKKRSRDHRNIRDISSNSYESNSRDTSSRKDAEGY
jgi:hypothetical protein